MLKKRLLLVLLLVTVIAVTAIFVIKASSNITVKDGELQIKTPYCVLRYPACWESYIHVAQKKTDVYTVVVSAKTAAVSKQPVFAIIFGESDEEYVGKIVTSNKEEVPVYVNTALYMDDSSVTDSDKEIILGMKADLDYMLEKMLFTESGDQSEADDVVIQTPYSTLLYPGKWEDYLSIETVEGEGTYTVSFYTDLGENKKQQIFDIDFNSARGEKLGVIELADGSQTTVNLVVYGLALDQNWTDEEQNIVYEMQDSAFHLIENIAFAQNDSAENSRVEASDVYIETPYCTLYYPGSLAKYLKTNITQEDVCIVEFYAVLTGYEETRIFDLVFGEVEGQYIGCVKAGDSTVPAYLTFYPFVLAEKWTQTEAAVVNSLFSYAENLAEQLPLVAPSVESIDGSAIPYDSESQTAEGCLLIETPYCNLYYPKKWEKNLKVLHEKEDPYCVHFTGKTTRGQEVQLFSVVFGGNPEDAVAVYTCPDGTEINICITAGELVLSKEANDEEILYFYQMQSGINDLLQALEAQEYITMLY